MTPLTSIFPYSYNEHEKDQLKIVVCLYWQELVLVSSFLLRLMRHLYFVQPPYQQAHSKDLSISMKAFPCIFHVFVCLAGIITHAYVQEKTYTFFSYLYILQHIAHPKPQQITVLSNVVYFFFSSIMPLSHMLT